MFRSFQFKLMGRHQQSAPRWQHGGQAVERLHLQQVSCATAANLVKTTSVEQAFAVSTDVPPYVSVYLSEIMEQIGCRKLCTHITNFACPKIALPLLHCLLYWFIQSLSNARCHSHRMAATQRASTRWSVERNRIANTPLRPPIVSVVVNETTAIRHRYRAVLVGGWLIPMDRYARISLPVVRTFLH